MPTGTTGTFQYQEGGGKYPPYQEDYFQRIVNVQWLQGATGAAPAVSGIFAIGDWCCFMCYIEVPSADTSKSTSKGIGAPIFTPDGAIYSGSYRKIGSTPTFVMGGNYDDALHPTDGIIAASSDGQNWRRVYTLNYPSYPPGTDMSKSALAGLVLAIVWDAGQFWACGHQSAAYYNSSGTFISTVEYDILLSSPDGWNWTELSRNQYISSGAGFDPGVPWPNTSMVLAHCSSKLLDHNGNPIPDGVYYYGTQDGKTVFVRPDGPVAMRYDYGHVDYSGVDASLSIDITDASGITTTKNNILPGLPFLTAVGFIDGVIVATGEDPNNPAYGPGTVGFAISTDMGDTWQVGIYEGYSPGITVLAAHWADIKGGL